MRNKFDIYVFIIAEFERFYYYNVGCYITILYGINWHPIFNRGRRGRDRAVVRYTTTCAISAYHHWRCEFEPRSLWGVLDTTLCDKVCQWPAAGRSFSPSTPPIKLTMTIYLKYCWTLVFYWKYKHSALTRKTTKNIAPLIVFFQILTTLMFIYF